MSLDEWFVAAAAKVGPTLPGFVGGVLSLRFFKDQSALEKAFTVAGGWACATWTTDPVLSYFALSNTHWGNGVTFFIGLFGMSIVAALMSAVRDLPLRDFIIGLLKKWSGS